MEKANEQPRIKTNNNLTCHHATSASQGCIVSINAIYNNAHIQGPHEWRLERVPGQESLTIPKQHRIEKRLGKKIAKDGDPKLRQTAAGKTVSLLISLPLSHEVLLGNRASRGTSAKDAWSGLSEGVAHFHSLLRTSPELFHC